MTKEEAKEILKNYNDWRRGNSDKQPNPTSITTAIDTLVEESNNNDIKQKDIFKVGDRVYDALYASWGTVIRITDRVYPLKVIFDIGKMDIYLPDGKQYSIHAHPRLSFTEYDFVNGGFSQERPLPKLKDGN